MRIRFRLPRALPVLQRHWFVTGITLLQSALASEDCEPSQAYRNKTGLGRLQQPGRGCTNINSRIRIQVILTNWKYNLEKEI
ncbi:unnamed protein product [Coccothraustes coccothraustes]